MKLNPIIFYTVIVSLGGFIFGFDASVVSGTIGQITTEFGLSPIDQGLVVAAPTLGAIISTLTAGYISDTIGRRTTLMIIALLYLVSALASAFAPSYDALVVARFIGGLAFCSLMIAPMYIAEISPAESRGKMVSVNQLNIVVGFSAAYFANYYILNLSQQPLEWVSAIQLDTQTWRWMLGVEIVPAALYFLCLFLIPRSPRWLVVQNRHEEAKSVLGRLYPGVSSSKLDDNIEEIKSTVDEKAQPLLSRLKEIFGSKVRVALVVGFILAIAQQATGVNVIYFYAPSIFEQSGVGTNAAFAQAIWLGLTNVVFTIVAMVLIDKLGRKPLLLIGLSGVFVSMVICSYGYNQATYQLSTESLNTLSSSFDSTPLVNIVEQTFTHDVDFKNAVIGAIGESTFQEHQGTIIQQAVTMNAPLVLFGILLFVASFAISLGPVMWVMFSEIFPNHLRGLAISIVGVVNSMVSFTTQLVFPWELATFGAAFAFGVFGLFALLGLFFVIKKVPETKGKSLEDIEHELLGERH